MAIGGLLAAWSIVILADIGLYYLIRFTQPV
jgi:hypothetical protein